MTKHTEAEDLKFTASTSDNPETVIAGTATVSKKSTKSDVPEEFTTDVSDEPLTVLITGTISGYNTTNANWWYPFLPQTINGTLTSGVVVQTTVSSGWASVNYAGFVFQNGQYNTAQRGF